MSQFSAFSQERIYITNQVSIDSFQKDSVFGSLIVSSDSILNLKGLLKIKYISNSLRIENCGNLENLDGIENITFIGDSIVIRQNNHLNN